LEFDSVIIPQLARGAKSSDRELLIWTEQIGEDGAPTLLVAVQPQKREKDSEYDHVSSILKTKEENELKRLFYVACTRPRNQLYLLGSIDTKNGGAECCEARKGTFLHLLWGTEKTEYTRQLRERRPVQSSLPLTETATPITRLHRLPSGWKAPTLTTSVSWQPELKRDIPSAQVIKYEWASGAGRHVGTIVHEMLKRVAEGGSEAWSARRMASMEPIVRSELLRLGILPSDEKKYTSRVMQAVQNVIESPRGLWILKNHAEARSEWAIAGRIGDRLISGTIDRSFRDEEGRLWIVDFKTSDHEGGQLDSFLDEERRRYQPQLESYASLLSQLTNGPIWLGLCFPLLNGWREWQFEEQAALTV